MPATSIPEPPIPEPRPQPEPIAEASKYQTEHTLSASKTLLLSELSMPSTFKTIKSRVKYENLLRNPQVTFCVVDRDDPMRYVELRGFATMEDDPDRSFLRSTFEAGGMEMPEDLDPPGTDRVTVRIHPQQSSSPHLYGGRFHQS